MRCPATTRCAASGSSGGSVGTVTACRSRWRRRRSSGSLAGRRSTRTASTGSTRAAGPSSATTNEWARLRHPPSTVGRLRQRLQDDRSLVHGDGHVGLRSLYDKGLVYEGYRVLAYCWRCETPLSNFETRIDDVYRDRQDPAVTVWFELEPTDDRPASAPRLDDHAVDAAVEPGARRRSGDRLRGDGGGRAALPLARPGSATTSGSSPVPRGSGPSRAPSWSAVATRRCSRSSPTSPNAFLVLAGDFVSTEDGTGAVHLSPGHGEDDQNLCNANGIDTVVPIDAQGRYTAEVEPWAGLHVFDANPLVIRALKDAGHVVRHETYDHPYPHCWRCGKPLVYRAVSSWFVQVTAFRDRMVGAQPADHLGARAHQGRQLRQVAGQRPRLVDQPQPLLGLTDPGLEERRPPLPAHRRLRQPRRAGAGLRRPPDRPPPADGRRARPAQPRRPDGQVGDAAGARGARLLVRVRLHAVRAGALPLREPGVVRGPLPRRLHRRVHRPDARLVLHAARARDGPVRPAGVQDLHRATACSSATTARRCRSACATTPTRSRCSTRTAPTPCAGTCCRPPCCGAATSS